MSRIARASWPFTRPGVPAATAAKTRDGLQSLVDDVEAASAEGAAEGGIPVDVLIGFYSPAEQGG
ncbi:MAG TPA: hypothetical protein VK162_24205 [Streptosporangiaceae bacterium]|nr:hypothetical protein [Streptosporangiaceae bacterium]